MEKTMAIENCLYIYKKLIINYIPTQLKTMNHLYVSGAFAIYINYSHLGIKHEI